MGLDIYSGKLTRYYSCNWKNIVQQLAEENGHKFVMKDSSGNEIKTVEDNTKIEQIRKAVIEWADDFASIIEPPLATPVWDETTESEYYTDKPDWEAYSALVMLQACYFMNRPLPKYVESGWNAFEEPVIKEAMSKEIVSSLIAGVTLWLPIPRDSIFATALPSGDEGAISTVSLLKHELDELNQQIWKADEATILSWRNDKYYFPIKRKEPKLILRFFCSNDKTQKEQFLTEELAQCAYSIFYQAVRFAEEHQVPILLDY